jgi:Skp family chaperone for outer membrane proteins
MKTYIGFAALALLVAAPVMAQTATPTDTAVPGHPRVNEVDQRLENQQKRIDSGVSSGAINAKQEARDQKTDAKVSQELSADEAKNGGHITKAEQTKLNAQLDKDGKRIHAQKVKAGVTPVSAPVATPAQ